MIEPLFAVMILAKLNHPELFFTRLPVETCEAMRVYAEKTKNYSVRCYPLYVETKGE